MNLIIDTNIIISAFIRDSKTREILIESNHTFYSPDYLKKEINNHQDLILEKSGLNQEEFELLFNLIMENVRIVPKEEYDNRTEKANSLLEEIDTKDVPFLACALAKNYPIWSDDNDLKEQDQIKVLKTHEVIKNTTEI